MKKFISVILVSLFLNFNIVKAQPNPVSNVYTEGVYKVSDFNLPSGHEYIIQNISNKDQLYVQVFNEDLITMQAIRLDPSSKKYNLLPLSPNYRVVIIGDGKLFVS
ncbi:hypothetical protein UT300007_17360 [Clostridium sp. CTA-7]